MFKLGEIKELIKLIDQTSIHELEIEKEGFRLAIRKPGHPETAEVHQAPAQTLPMVPVPTVIPAQPPAASFPAAPAAQPPSASQTPDAPAAAPAESADNLHTITSPMVGTFYAAPSPTSPPYVQKGDKVTPKTIVCIVEAMKLMNEIEAEVSGEIVEVLVENGQLVEFGQPLFLVKLA